jgi:hypothetical protein
MLFAALGASRGKRAAAKAWFHAHGYGLGAGRFRTASFRALGSAKKMVALLVG